MMLLTCWVTSDNNGVGVALRGGFAREKYVFSSLEKLG